MLGVPNFGWVESWLARGGQPSVAGFVSLAARGIRTIVNLRAEDAGEAELAEVRALKYVHVPVVDGTAPTVDQAHAWLALCADATHHPIFVHCFGGKGRTSVFCTLVRLAQGWSLEAAMQEAIDRYAFDPELDRLQVDFLTYWCREFGDRRLVKFD